MTRATKKKPAGAPTFDPKRESLDGKVENNEVSLNRYLVANVSKSNCCAKTKILMYTDVLIDIRLGQ